MANRYYSIQTDAITLNSGTTYYPLVITAGGPARVVELAMSFDGNAATDDQLKAEWLRVASVTGGTSITGDAVDDENGTASATTAVYSATSVGATEKETWREYIHPQGGYVYRPGVHMVSGEVWALKLTTYTQGHSGMFRIVVEE